MTVATAAYVVVIVNGNDTLSGLFQVPVVYCPHCIRVLKQWGYKEEGGNKDITFPIAAKTLFCVILTTENNGTVMANVKEDSASTTGFSIWQYGSNQYNLPTWWLCICK